MRNILSICFAGIFFVQGCRSVEAPVDEFSCEGCQVSLDECERELAINPMNPDVFSDYLGALPFEDRYKANVYLETMNLSSDTQLRVLTAPILGYSGWTDLKQIVEFYRGKIDGPHYNYCQKMVRDNERDLALLDLVLNGMRIGEFQSLTKVEYKRLAELYWIEPDRYELLKKAIFQFDVAAYAKNKDRNKCHLALLLKLHRYVLSNDSDEDVLVQNNYRRFHYWSFLPY